MEMAKEEKNEDEEEYGLNIQCNTRRFTVGDEGKFILILLGSGDEKEVEGKKKEQWP